MIIRRYVRCQCDTLAWPFHVLGLGAASERVGAPQKVLPPTKIIMIMNAVFKFVLVMSAIPFLAAQKVEKFPLSSLGGLKFQQLEAESVHYRGRDAIHLAATSKTKGEPIVILTNSDFENGTIELDLAGAPPAGASDSARGSVGVAFHLQSPTRFECFYLRMTNARADDQVRRNHTLQYISVPDFPFETHASGNAGALLIVCGS